MTEELGVENLSTGWQQCQLGRRAALITIGQSPRPDLLDALQLAERQDVNLFGALDSLNTSQMQDMIWSPGDASLPLFVWYDGQPLVVSKHLLARHVVATVGQAMDQGFSVVTVLCTESFPEVQVDSKTQNIRIDRLLFDWLRDMFPDPLSPRVGVLVPVEGQVVPSETRWSLVGEARAICLAPRSSDDLIRDRCRRLVEVCGAPLDVVVLDCMGYGAGEHTIVKEELGAPVLWAQELLKFELHKYLRITDANRGGSGYGHGITV